MINGWQEGSLEFGMNGDLVEHPQVVDEEEDYEDNDS